VPQTIVVVTFYCRTGEVERLATAAAVGAVQARAGIRMRRLSDVDVARARTDDPQRRDVVDRMLREYVPPREADLLAADGLVIGSPPELGAASAEWAPYFAMLERLKADGKLAGKTAAVVGAGESRDAMAAALRSLGLTVVTSPAAGDVDQAVALGRNVVAAVASRTAPA
jgi:multimeric flavodoxin WrbA